MPDPVTRGQGPAGPTLVLATGHHLSLALLDGEQVVAEHHQALERGHAEALMPAVRRLLDGRPRPTSILVEVGPGSFTGLRVGVAAARALGLAWGCPVDGVSSMGLVAAGAARRGHRGPLLVMLLAPRGQTWIQKFDGLQPLGPAQSLAAEAARRLAAAAGCPATGSGARALGLCGAEDRPRAAWAGRLGRDQWRPPLPLYVRPVEDALAA